MKFSEAHFVALRHARIKWFWRVLDHNFYRSFFGMHFSLWIGDEDRTQFWQPRFVRYIGFVFESLVEDFC